MFIDVSFHIKNTRINTYIRTCHMHFGLAWFRETKFNPLLDCQNILIDGAQGLR